MTHIPVMLTESIELLRVIEGRWYVDGTFGAGGHSTAILERGGRVLALDKDPAAEDHAQDLRGSDFHFKQSNFRDLASVLMTTGITCIHGVLFDLGVSSMQLSQAERGFSYRKDGPLDMRMDQIGTDASDIVNNATEAELAETIYRFGEDRYSRRIARAIVKARTSQPIKSTQDLRKVLEYAYPPGKRRKHPARKTFQALRIAVNDELGALKIGLHTARTALSDGGRLVVLSYHSLEDRIMKQFLNASQDLQVLTKRPLTPSIEEKSTNPRARSAKLRAGEKVSA
jgi:16S rRNA (cytosine1402-N4)-methyltransferase